MNPVEELIEAAARSASNHDESVPYRVIEKARRWLEQAGKGPCDGYHRGVLNADAICEDCHHYFDGDKWLPIPGLPAPDRTEPCQSCISYHAAGHEARLRPTYGKSPMELIQQIQWEIKGILDALPQPERGEEGK